MADHLVSHPAVTTGVTAERAAAPGPADHAGQPPRELPDGWEYALPPPPDIPWDDIDPDIAPALHALADYGIDTFSSCQGGPGHGGGMASIMFHGDEHAGLWAVWLLEAQGFRVQALSRTWDLDFGQPRSPFWEVTLRCLEPSGPRPGTCLVRETAAGPGSR